MTKNNDGSALQVLWTPHGDSTNGRCNTHSLDDSGLLVLIQGLVHVKGIWDRLRSTGTLTPSGTGGSSLWDLAVYKCHKVV